MSLEELSRRLEPMLARERLGRRRAELKLNLVQRLATGSPVTLDDALLTSLAPGTTLEDGREELARLGAKFDDQDRLIAFGGLSLSATRHRLRVGEEELYAWCAADTLFLPALLKQSVDVESHCPVSGTPIRLRVTPEAIEDAEPAGIVVSFLVPAEARLEGKVGSPDACCSVECDTESPTTGGCGDFRGIVGSGGSFCGNVHFFRSAQDSETWLATHPDAFTLPLQAAFELSRKLWADPLLAGTPPDLPEAHV